ncbi:cyclin [Anaeramoeba ignava]|uniref:Cyclin n=1 Tax=Anaeramoeba ignava TaxID=1746090 RepID=A0A9Q0LJX7_ANAIG|nr:cyclin [Anaeramoeba ignava]
MESESDFRKKIKFNTSFNGLEMNQLLENLKNQEELFFVEFNKIVEDYLAEQPIILPTKKIIEFIQIFSRKKNLETKTTHIALILLIYYLRKYFQGEIVEVENISPVWICLRSLSCLQIASKRNDVDFLKIEEIQNASVFSFTKKQIEDSELKILTTLSFKVNILIPLDFIEIFLYCLKFDFVKENDFFQLCVDINNLIFCHKTLLVMLCQTKYSLIGASIITAASLILNIFNPKLVKILSKLSGYSKLEIIQISNQVLSTILNPDLAKLYVLPEEKEDLYSSSTSYSSSKELLSPKHLQKKKEN